MANLHGLISIQTGAVGDQGEAKAADAALACNRDFMAGGHAEKKMCVLVEIFENLFFFTK